MKDVNTVICGEATKILAEFPSECVDLVVTSPPYDNLRDYNGYTFNYKDMAKSLLRVVKPGGIVVWVVGDETKNFSESLTSFRQAIFFHDVCGFNLLDTMIYEKNGGPSPYPGLRRYSPWFEYMFVFSKGKPKVFNPIKDKELKGAEGKINSGNTARQKDGTTKSSGSYIQKKYGIRHNVWKYQVGKGKDTSNKDALIHPARFPEKLAHDHIISWSNLGDLVLDPMCGSGTTLVEAKKTGRNFIGIDISKDYCVVSKKRISTTTPQEGKP